MDKYIIWIRRELYCHQTKQSEPIYNIITYITYYQ